MPYPNEHLDRIRDPGDKEKSSLAEIEKRTYSFNLEIREDDGEPKLIGHAAVFDEIGGDKYFKEKINAGAFKKSIKKDDIRALFNHDSNIVLGRNKAGTLKLEEDDKGLAIEITPPDTQLVKDMVLGPIKRGDISQMSFAFVTLKDTWEESEDSEPTLRIVQEVKLFDVSPVTFPFYEGTDIAMRSLEEWSEKISKPATSHHVALLKKRLNLRRIGG